MSPGNPFTAFHKLKRLGTNATHGISSRDGEMLWPRSDEERRVVESAKEIMRPAEPQIEEGELTAFINLCEDLWEEAHGTHGA